MLNQLEGGVGAIFHNEVDFLADFIQVKAFGF